MLPGAAATGWTLGQAITGKRVTFGGKVCGLSDDERSEAWVTGGAGAVALGLAGWADKSFQPWWRYGRTGPNPIYENGDVVDGVWLTRGSEPPYGYDWSLSKDKLQLPKIPNKVEKINVPWWRYVGGPRIVEGNSGFGSGGDWEWRTGGFDE